MSSLEPCDGASPDDARTIETCRLASRRSRDWLLEVHDAGTALSAIPREPGARTSSHDETRFQRVCREAEIGRATAHRWITLSQVISRDALRLAIDYAMKNGGEITLTGLIGGKRTTDAPKEFPLVDVGPCSTCGRSCGCKPPSLAEAA